MEERIAGPKQAAVERKKRGRKSSEEERTEHPRVFPGHRHPHPLQTEYSSQVVTFPKKQEEEEEEDEEKWEVTMNQRGEEGRRGQRLPSQWKGLRPLHPMKKAKKTAKKTTTGKKKKTTGKRKGKRKPRDVEARKDRRFHKGFRRQRTP